MVKLVNRAKVSTTTTGTGTMALGPAAAGFQSFAGAGVLDGDQVRYVIEDGDAWEIGTGSYAAAGPSLTRSVLQSSSGGAAIALSGEATVFLTAAAEDIGGQSLGAIGTYALLGAVNSGTRAPVLGPGQLRAASALYYANTHTQVSAEGVISSPRPTGTWRCMGNIGYYWIGSWGFREISAGDALGNITLWLRVA
jgi:hypothetical protein